MISTGWSLQHETSCSTVEMKDAVINTGRIGRVDVTMKLQQVNGVFKFKAFLVYFPSEGACDVYSAKVGVNRLNSNFTSRSLDSGLVLTWTHTCHMHPCLN